MKTILFFSQMSGSFYKGIRSGEWKEAAEDFKKGLAIFEKELEKRKSPFFGGKYSWFQFKCPM